MPFMLGNTVYRLHAVKIVSSLLSRKTLVSQTFPIHHTSFSDITLTTPFNSSLRSNLLLTFRANECYLTFLCFYHKPNKSRFYKRSEHQPIRIFTVCSLFYWRHRRSPFGISSIWFSDYRSSVFSRKERVVCKALKMNPNRSDRQVSVQES